LQVDGAPAAKVAGNKSQFKWRPSQHAWPKRWPLLLGLPHLPHTIYWFSFSFLLSACYLLLSFAPFLWVRSFVAERVKFVAEPVQCWCGKYRIGKIER